MAKVNLIYYKHNKLGTLFISDNYVYEMLVYHIEKRQISLYESKENTNQQTRP